MKRVVAQDEPCPTCGAPMIYWLPDDVGVADIPHKIRAATTFLRQGAIDASRPLHPGRYCERGCIVTRFNFGNDRAVKAAEALRRRRENASVVVRPASHADTPLKRFKIYLDRDVRGSVHRDRFVVPKHCAYIELEPGDHTLVVRDFDHLAVNRRESNTIRFHIEAQERLAFTLTLVDGRLQLRRDDEHDSALEAPDAREHLQASLDHSARGRRHSGAASQGASVMMQMVELHFRRAPQVDYAAVKARAEELLGGEIECPDPEQADKAFLMFHMQHMVEYTDGKAPAQTAILAADERPNVEALRPVIQQSWSCPGAEELLRSCTRTRAVVELMARSLPPQERVELFHGVLRAMIEVSEPDALVFTHSQQVVAPADYLASGDLDPILRPGSLNVRFFNISNSEGDKIMDVRGLAEVGLHDLQCHFRELDPDEVARVLFNTAVYLFGKGAVIESGQTVQGIEPGSKWRCQFEDSLLEPKRELLDLNPGPPFAAGGR